MASATYQLIVSAIEKFLVSNNSNSSKNSKSNKEIVFYIRSKIANGDLQIEVTDGTIISYLSNAANNDNNSSIVSGGPKGGYWLDESVKSYPEMKPVEEEHIKTEKSGPVTILEKDLYPLVELWLEKKRYVAKDMSTLKSGGRWGNPDIIGAERVDVFGMVEIEMESCEIKLSEKNWEQMIFEAISHKRFSNRSWFCYRVIKDQTPLPKGIEYYAEKYKIGIVQIILSDAELVDLKNNKKTPLDLIDSVVECFPALYDQVPLREKRDLIDRSGIVPTLKF
jgi:hypothetical protein